MNENEEIDELTGLLNRKEFEKRLQGEIDKAKRFGTPLTLVYLDVNDLKVVNDTKGHPEGDKLLQNVAEVLTKNGGEKVIVARNGEKADEFAAILIGKVLEESNEFLDNLREGFEAANIHIAGGASQIDTRTNQTILESKRLADLTMHKAKRASKDAKKNIIYTTSDLSTDEILEVA